MQLEDYTTGTVSITNGSATLTGTGTAWDVAGFKAGDTFHAQGLVGIIASVVSDTSITLRDVWAGTSISGGSYLLRYQPDNSRMQGTTRQLLDQLRAGIWLNPDATGKTADKSTYDAKPAGFKFLDVSVDPFKLYVKESDTSGDWSNGADWVGPAGDAGAPGVAASVAVGTVTTGAAGSAADVTNSGTSTAAVLDFTIPKGDIGPANSLSIGAVDGGPVAAATITGTAPDQTLNLTLPKGDVGNTGPAWDQFQGEYASASAYVKNDVVQDNGSTWIALQATTGNAPPVLPTTSNSYWELIAAKGTDGTGTGDVVGPASAVDGNIALFDGTTGKLVKDSGQPVAGLVATSTTDASSFGFVAGKDDTPADASKVVPTVDRVDAETVYKVADRTALKALSGTVHPVAYLYEAGREGVFKWNISDLSAFVTVDTAEGIYVAPTSDTTGASGAWVRQGWAVSGFDPAWFGAVGDGSDHALSTIFSTLTEAQAIYPKATALTDMIDWAALQAAVDLSVSMRKAGWLGSFTKKLYNGPAIRPGMRTYRTHKAVEAAEPVDWIGVCDQSVIESSSGGIKINISESAQGLTFEGMTLIAIAQAAGIGLEIVNLQSASGVGPDGVKIINNRISSDIGAGGHGWTKILRLQKVDNFNISQNVIRGSSDPTKWSSMGIELAGQTIAGNIRGNFILGCVVGLSITSDDTQGLFVDHNQIYANEWALISNTGGAAHFVVTDNYLSGWKGCVQLTNRAALIFARNNVDHGTIAGNVPPDNSVAAQISSTTACRIAENDFSGPDATVGSGTSTGLLLSNIDFSGVHDNYFSNFRHPVTINSLGDSNIVRDTRLWKCGDVINDLGTNNDITGTSSL